MESDEANADNMAEAPEGGQRRRRKRGFDIGPDMGNY